MLILSMFPHFQFKSDRNREPIHHFCFLQIVFTRSGHKARIQDSDLNGSFQVTNNHKIELNGSERHTVDAGNKFGGESFIVVIVFLFLVFVLLQHPESTG